MRVQSAVLALLGSLTFSLSSASPHHEPSVPKLPKFPEIKLGPKLPGDFQIPKKPNRRKVCIVKSGKGDAGPRIMAAARQCNHGGTVFLPEGHNYTISSVLDLTFLDHIDFAFYGNIVFEDDINLWPSQTFQYPFQSVSLWWRFGGTDVNIYGGGKGTIDARGQTYWTAMTYISNVHRPTTIGFDGLKRSTVTGLNIRNPPGWSTFIGNSTNVLFSNFDISVKVTNATSPAKNTDAFDTFRSNNIVIQNSRVVNTDDCVSFKPNSTGIIVQNMDCTGSHGISVGSLGQYVGQVDIVEHLHVYNISMTNATDGARIKVFAGQQDGKPDSGGGTGRVHNVTYELFGNHNNAHAIALTQCYYAKNQTWCDENPSKVTIDTIKFLDFYGVTSTKYDPRVGELRCSQPDVCTNIIAHNISVVPPSGKPPRYDCLNFDLTNVDMPCVIPPA